MKVFLGFDPGGERKFGWAVCIGGDDVLDIVDKGVADHAQGAMDFALKAIPKGKDVSGAGIDAPMFWVCDGGREVDRLVRKAIGLLWARSPGGAVQHFNSLRGACVIQGLLVLKLLRQLFPHLPITEAHPKALLWLLGIGRKSKAKIDAIEGINIKEENFTEDERDAILGAFAAKMMIQRKSDWVDLLEYEKKERILAAEPPIGYWMPRKLIDQ